MPPPRLPVETALGPRVVDGDILLANALRFGRILRRAGLEVEPGQTATFVRALAILGVDRRGDVRAAGRAIFVRRREDRAVYEAAFDLFWRRRGGGSAPDVALPRLRQERGGAPGSPQPERDGRPAEETVAAVRPEAASARCTPPAYARTSPPVPSFVPP